MVGHCGRAVPCIGWQLRQDATQGANGVWSAINHRLQLKRDCFGTGIIRKCTKWSEIAVHGLFRQCFAIFRRAVVLNLEKHLKTHNELKKSKWNWTMQFSVNAYLRICKCHTKLGKTKQHRNISVYMYKYIYIYIHIYIYVYMYIHTYNQKWSNRIQLSINEFDLACK